MVELAGIGHTGQPVRLHAHCRSQARRMRLETPAHPAFIYERRGFDTSIKSTNKNTTARWYYLFGGAGGNRTRVRKSSTDSSTYLALLFNLICTTPTDKRCTDELPKG
jgi:hypothetical protein